MAHHLIHDPSVPGIAFQVADQQSSDGAFLHWLPQLVQLIGQGVNLHEPLFHVFLSLRAGEERELLLAHLRGCHLLI